MLAPTGGKCDPMAVLALHYGPYRMGVMRNPCKVGWIQRPHGNGPAVDDYAVFPDLDGLAGEPQDPFEEHGPQPRIVKDMEQN